MSIFPKTKALSTEPRSRQFARSGEIALAIGEAEEEKDNDITIKIAVAGNVDSGKSTLAGVLLNDCLDDGRGKCRKMIFHVMPPYTTLESWT